MHGTHATLSFDKISPFRFTRRNIGFDVPQSVLLPGTNLNVDIHLKGVAIMAVSIFLAKLFGLYLIIISTLFFIRREALIQTIQSFMANSALVMLASIYNLIGGLAVTIGHPVWGFQWELLVSLIGLSMLIKGFCGLGFPTTFFQWNLSFIQKKAKWNWMLGITLVVGLFLTVKGFIA